MDVVITVMFLVASYGLGWINGRNDGIKGEYKSKDVFVWHDPQE